MNIPASDPVQLYDPVMALEFFKSAGEAEEIDKGEMIFGENQKANRLLLQRDKMYLLLKGEVGIVAEKEKQVVGIIKPGEIFGEMAPLTQSARSASAMAKTVCRVIGLDDRQFLAGLEKKPEFALMLMSVMIRRLRDTIARRRAAQALPGDETGKESAVFDRKTLAALTRELGNEPTVRYRRDSTILQEGGSGVQMYVVIEGRVAAYIQGSLVELIGPGGVFGEMTLVDQAPRVASAIADSDCALLAINRKTFLDLIKSNPAFGASLLRALADRLRFMTSGKK
ncbi:MAG: cyclic nucleotide-binding domain-containing protein [Betaproteobacteria bacterium]|nr:cyclic nucleotide-binding domain-containing protein [Betaproteobacteria bacterium]